MNLISGRINWIANIGENKQNNSGFENGRLKLSVQKFHNFIYDDKPYIYNGRNKTLCSVIGYVSNLEEIRRRYSIDKIDVVAVVERLYLNEGIEILSELDGVFLIFVYDENAQKCYLAQSEHGFGLPIYYTLINDGVVFSTSLKQLLKQTPSQRELNIRAARDFLYYGSVIPNESTLIENIHKLIATRYLEINWITHSIKIKKLRAERRKASRRTAKDSLIKSIDNSINNLYKSLKDDNISLTLTGGWDSNYILFNFCKLTDSQIKAVTIDGGGAKNEVPAARLLLENYNNVDHLTGEVEENSTNLLPAMVWRYDGYIFQEGMFLRYELAKILSEVGSKLVVLAACADQILYQRPIIVRTYKKLEQLYIIKNYRGERLSRHEFKFRRGSITPSNNEVQDLEIEYLLKMHDVMNNSFGVQSIYPFLDKNILSICKALGIQNRRKQFYKSELRRILGSEIIQHMAKSGSVVDTYQMFKSNENKLIGIIDTQLAGEILTKNQINELKRKPSLYHLFIMQLVYIYLFNELFISGYYDVDFGKTNLNLALDSFSF